MKKNKTNLKNETCILTYCKVFNRKGIYIGKGYSLIRQDGNVVPILGDIRGNELEGQVLEVRHGDEQRLVVTCWVVQ